MSDRVCANPLVVSGDERGYIDSRVQDIEKAGIRSRWIYGAMSLLSLLLFSVAFNEYFSWSRKIAMTLPKVYQEDEWSAQLKLLLMREWASALQFDVPYLGGKFGASDAGIVGGVVLALAAIWCYYSARRENRLVYFLVKDFKEFGFSDASRFYLCNQLFSTQLFVNESSRGAYSRESLERVKEDQDGNPIPKPPPGLFGRAVAVLLRLGLFVVFVTPPLALFFVFVTDILTLDAVSPFRNDGRILYDHLCGGIPWFQFLSCKDSGLVSRMIISFALMVLVALIMLQAWSFQKGTEEIVNYTVGWKAPILSKRVASDALPIPPIQG